MLTAAVLSVLLTMPIQKPSVVRIAQAGDAYSLTVDGKPFFIKGVGGGASKPQVKELGANAFRTWGVEEAEKSLEEAKRLGMKVAIGIWLGHKEHGFKYDDPEMVRKQFEAAKTAVLKYRDHPALLMWGIGNEMEGYGDGADPKVWEAVQDIAKMIKAEDKNHPTMTVIAEIGGKKVESIHRYCPDVDVVGINSYGGGPSILERYRKQGGTKPYIITEFGTLGPWEVGKNSWGVEPEPLSTAKAVFYRRTYEQSVVGAKGLCLGSFAFLWGDKQEATATWFGMLLSTGERVAAADTMSELWTGKPVPNRCPVIEEILVQGAVEVPLGSSISFTVKASDPEKDALTYKWVLQRESHDRKIGGAEEKVPSTYPTAVTANGAEASAKPPEAGKYRMFVYIYDGKGGAAVGNVPLHVLGG